MRRRRKYRRDIACPYAKHLEKSKVYFAIESIRPDIFIRPVVIEPCYDFGLAKADKRARIYRGNLINAEHPLENNRRCFRFTFEAIGLNALL